MFRIKQRPCSQSCILQKLAKNEQVAWSHLFKGFEFPPATIQKKIAAAAEKAEIELSISDGDE